MTEVNKNKDKVSEKPCCGLVIGKFMPLHLGHVALIRFALKRCKQLTVAVVSKPSDPISFEVRLGWFEKLFKGAVTVKVVDLKAVHLPVTGGHTPEAEAAWTRYFAEAFPETDILFSSESYGDVLATALGIPHCLYDPNRNGHPVSGAQIRRNPEAYRDYLPEIVYKDLIKVHS
ncbi:adenylyltransferase/cytidyltransferase family protein [Acidaminobacter hydrogenoformans]|uniref:Cytidyltransferase-like domain-containing protein n=1 Tax=Acidaminobacter hydrogenoformans DSM 2784 TaxID=1120920 RepID=A0A1G5S5F1_9FIRM|nr:adenylyltransferase/cytidyltransferase family protein [Acidaminobacter hydrogenoformans]SCZ81556.1 cytidyltransferase-like domain-containing protein [Acidaminobacter hydrogenoformans DSM 2784]